MAIISECTFIDAELLKTKEVVIDYSSIDGETCRFELPVFAYPSDTTDKYRNDFTTTLLPLSNRYTTPELYLETETSCDTWTEVAQLTDSTYGTYYSIPSKANWIGYRIDWYKVYNSEGVGCYRIRQEYTDTLEATTKVNYSYKYNLKLYTDELADQTVKIEYKINGGIRGVINDQKDIIDYGSVQWEREVRLPFGFFGFPTSENIQEFVRYKNGAQVWTENSAVENYQLIVKRIPFYLHREMSITMMFADEIYMYDYNTSNPNPDKYNRFRVAPISGYEPNWTSYTTYASVNLTFKPYYENIRAKRC